MTPLAAVPTLDAVADGQPLDGLPAAALAALFERSAVSTARLQARLLVAGITPRPSTASPATGPPDDLITLDEAAKIVRRSPVWLRRQKLPFARRVSRKCVLVSRSKLLRWIETRAAS